ncbi:MAG: hypothetical protein DIZ80_00320 [endosymbiont of Galathealinum brachiosum]|uniref:Uncharacterized protein n=1 Tax=endosymbiont of Galathealinum brachiosum TaxID=2200906 RepID=A0A370DP89_9GAMM|nr:MAG: hypothetical protein DIZ80_00320 [endosymbiont of Galathealinum brachiosum]
MKIIVFIILIFTITFSLNSVAEIAPTNSELEKWFNSDDELSTEHVNEGELNFLEKTPEIPNFHSINRLSISQESLITGWVLLEQCYENLDPVPVTDIEYQYKSIRNLRITTQQNIEAATVDNKTIHLDTVNKNAKLCIKAEVKILKKMNNTHFSLTNGPFHRQFLDGYYPYHLSLQINYPSSILQLASTSPRNQKGFIVKKEVDMLYIESHFEGKLIIHFMFNKIIANS